MSTILLTALLIRNTAVTSEDDRITVCRQDDVLYVKYYDSHSKKNYELNLGNAPLWSYVRNLCKMFVTDMDPFKQLQLNFHGFPTYMMTTNSVTPDTLAMLQDVCEIVSKSAEEDLYADMPPLIHCRHNFADDTSFSKQRR
jgi:hypothetical protein